MFHKTDPLIVRINTRQLKGEGRKNNPLGIKITFPGLARLAVSYNLRNSFSPELFWVLRNKIRQNVPVELCCSQSGRKEKPFVHLRKKAHWSSQVLFLALL